MYSKIKIINIKKYNKFNVTVKNKKKKVIIRRLILNKMKINIPPRTYCQYTKLNKTKALKEIDYICQKCIIIKKKN